MHVLISVGICVRAGVCTRFVDNQRMLVTRLKFSALVLKSALVGSLAEPTSVAVCQKSQYC